MSRRIASVVLAIALAGAQFAASPARAENQMGYRLLSVQEASALPRRGGALGLAVAAAQEINDSGLTFEVLRVTATRPGSPAAQVGLKSGDLIIAADGRVFPGVLTFSAYVGSVPQGGQITLDYIPAGGGPKEAQRVAVTVAAGGRPAAAQAEQPEKDAGLSTGSKLAIGVGAAALFGCYELGCFSRGRTGPGAHGQLTPVAPR